MRRLKLVITELEFGGAEQRLVDLATQLDRDKYMTSVVALGPPPAPGDDGLVRQLAEANVPVSFLGARGTMDFWRTRSRLKREFRQNPADVVQSFLFHANVLTALARPRAVTHIAGVRVAEPRKWRMFWERIALRRAAKIVCVSNSVTDHLLSGGFPASQLVTIPNGIDIERMDAFASCSRAELQVSEDADLIAVVGRLDPQKGTDWLIQQIPHLVRERPNLCFVFCGRGDAAVYQTQVDHLAVADHVRFLGWRGDVIGIMKAADLLLLPSRWEGMPNVVLEAMALKLPVVATAVHGVIELLGPAASKMTFQPNEPDSLATAIDYWCQKDNDDEQRKSLFDNRYRSENEFSLDRMVLYYERLYDRLGQG
jgi:glycosyltransferase involved in cell wall biosynthesis